MILIAGQMNVSLGSWLIVGLCIGLLTALLTTLLFSLLLRTNYWKPETDEDASEAMLETEASDAQAPAASEGPGLLLASAPIIVPLLMIAFGAFAKLAGISNDVIGFIGNANLALFVGLLGAYLMARRWIGVERTSEALTDGFKTSGEILLITGVGGSLGAIITASGMGAELGKLFSTDAAGPVLLSIVLAWFIAAVLHVAIGSVSVAALTAASIIGPVVAQLSTSPVIIGLAIASGSLFAVQVNSNFFWMVTALASLTSLLMVVLASMLG
ncbi:DsdX permease [compost metagenome]